MRDEPPAPFLEEPGGLGGLRVVARGDTVGRLVAPADLVGRMVVAGAASPGGRPSEWEDVVAVAAGGEPVGWGVSGWGTAVIIITVDVVSVGGCPSG